MLNDSQSINKAFRSWLLLASVRGPVHNVCDKNNLKGSNNVDDEFLKSCHSLSSHVGGGGAPGRPDREESTGDTGVPLVTYRSPPPKM